MLEQTQTLLQNLTLTDRSQPSLQPPQQSPQLPLPQYLQTLPQKLTQILSTLLTQTTQLQQKYSQQSQKLLKQLQQKDKLILSLTKINNTLMKQNTRMRKKSQAQFQYFVRRIAETQCQALNDKRNLEDAIRLCEGVMGKIGGIGDGVGGGEDRVRLKEVQDRINSVKDLNIQLMNLPSTPKSPKKSPKKSQTTNPQISNSISFTSPTSNATPTPTPTSTSTPTSLAYPLHKNSYNPNNNKLINSTCLYKNPEKQELRFRRDKELIIQI